MNETRICANCGAEHPIDEMFQVENDWLCEDCADRNLHKFLFRSLSVPPFRLVNLNILQQAA